MDTDLTEEANGLEPSNVKHVYGILRQMSKDLNLTKGEYVTLDLTSIYPEFWDAEGVKTIATTKVREIKRHLLDYLHEIGVVKAVRDEGLSANVQVNRARFDQLYRLLKVKVFKETLDTTSRLIAAHRKPAEATTPAQPIYEITFKDGVILLNNIYLSKPQYGSVNYDFFDLIYKSPNQRHNVQELIAKMNQKLDKTIHQILNDLGFKNDLKVFFFPKASTSFVEFNNPVTAEQMKARELGFLKVEVGRKTPKSSRSSQNQ